MKSSLISATLKLAFCCTFLLSFNSFAQDELDSLVFDSLSVDEIQIESPFLELYEGLSADEIDENYNAIRTDGLIRNVSQVPDPRTGVADYSQVSDPHNMLSANAIDTLDKIMKRVE
ncbi:MAG: hypothetical protein ACI857_001741, partial [Arenicella sp.]